MEREDVWGGSLKQNGFLNVSEASKGRMNRVCVLGNTTPNIPRGSFSIEDRKPGKCIVLLQEISADPGQPGNPE